MSPWSDISILEFRLKLRSPCCFSARLLGHMRTRYQISGLSAHIAATCSLFLCGNRYNWPGTTHLSVTLWGKCHGWVLVWAYICKVIFQHFCSLKFAPLCFCVFVSVLRVCVPHQVALKVRPDLREASRHTFHSPPFTPLTWFPPFIHNRVNEICHHLAQCLLWVDSFLCQVKISMRLQWRV